MRARCFHGKGDQDDLRDEYNIRLHWRVDEDEAKVVRSSSIFWGLALWSKVVEQVYRQSSLGNAKVNVIGELKFAKRDI